MLILRTYWNLPPNKKFHGVLRVFHFIPSSSKCKISVGYLSPLFWSRNQRVWILALLVFVSNCYGENVLFLFYVWGMKRLHQKVRLKFSKETRYKSNYMVSTKFSTCIHQHTIMKVIFQQICHMYILTHGNLQPYRYHVFPEKIEDITYQPLHSGPMYMDLVQ